MTYRRAVQSLANRHNTRGRRRVVVGDDPSSPTPHHAALAPGQQFSAPPPGHKTAATSTPMTQFPDGRARSVATCQENTRRAALTQRSQPVTAAGPQASGATPSTARRPKGVSNNVVSQVPPPNHHPAARVPSPQGYGLTCRVVLALVQGVRHVCAASHSLGQGSSVSLPSAFSTHDSCL